MVFNKFGIGEELVPIAMTALERHSQNDILYDPLKAQNISEEELQDADRVFAWLKLPFDTKVSMKDFKEVMKTDD